MAYGYNNKKSFTPTPTQNWICIGDGETSAFYLTQIRAGAAVPAGAVQADDRYLKAVMQNIEMNAAAGWLFDAKLNMFAQAAAAGEGFLPFPEDFMVSQQVHVLRDGRRVLAGKITRAKLEDNLAFATEEANVELAAEANYLLALIDSVNQASAPQSVPTTDNAQDTNSQEADMNTFINITLCENDFEDFQDTDIPATQEEQESRVLAAVKAVYPDADVSISRASLMEASVATSVNTSVHGIGTRGNSQGTEDEGAAAEARERVFTIIGSIDENSADWAIAA